MESHNIWKLVSLSPHGSALLVVMALAIGGGVAMACWGVRGESARSRRWLLYALRIIVGAAMVFFLIEPAVRSLSVARMKQRVAILVDRSASMEFPVKPAEESRRMAAANAIDPLIHQFAAQNDRFDVELISFASELASISIDEIRQTPGRASKTDIAGALRSTLSTSSGAQKLAGIIVFSDGADTVDLRAGLTSQLSAQLKEKRVPVTTVAIGQSVLTDLSIENIKVDDFAFVRNSVSVDVELHARGLRDARFYLVLRSEVQVIATKPVMISQDDETQHVTLTFKPDETGRFVYTASVPVLQDETVAENNTRSFTLKVIRDRIRVLLVAGRPTWDERFIRGVLRADSNVDLVSFYILRQASDQSNVADDSRELSLIPFPRDEIFREQIATFDLVMVLNFGHDDPQVALGMYRQDIEAYVKNGGALAYLGGDRSFGENRGAGSPFGDLLPVESAGPADEGLFSPLVTPEGMRHPVTSIAPSAEELPRFWAELPLIAGINRTRARPGAFVLLEHPTLIVDGRKAPLLAVHEIGRGRTFALMTDSSWNWAFESASSGVQTRGYERFWKNTIRWLVRDPDFSTLSVIAGAGSVEPGQPISASARVRGPDYLPRAGAEVQVDLVRADDGRVVAQQKKTTSADGTAEIEWPPPEPGAYKIVARTLIDGGAPIENSDSVAVRSTGPELSNAQVNLALLAEISKASGGRFFDVPTIDLSQVPLVDPPLVEVGRSIDLPLWDRWHWLVLALVALTAEWGARRHFGYV